jgi:hypothetical protein
VQICLIHFYKSSTELHMGDALKRPHDGDGGVGEFKTREIMICDAKDFQSNLGYIFFLKLFERFIDNFIMSRKSFSK